MNETISIILLVSVPGLPLLLAFSALRARLPWFRYGALLPAALVALLPISYSVELPWLLFGSELRIDGVSRLLLGVSVLLWLAAAASFSKASTDSENQLTASANGSPLVHLNPMFFLLAMAGNFGAILANDVVLFFVSTMLLGYAFYGLLVTTVQGELQVEALRAGRIYLVAMIVADLLLFEVLLIIAFVTDNLSFAAVHQDIVQSDSSSLYLWLVLLGFALKAGIWPLHFWLLVVLRRVRPALALLLCAVPLSMALLGMLRWLPLGEISTPETALVVQSAGVIAVLYAIGFGLLSWSKKESKNTVALYSIVLISGLFIMAIGTGLSDAATWDRYENSLYVLLAILILASAVLLALTMLTSSKSSGQTSSSTSTERTDADSAWFERWATSTVYWVANICNNKLPKWQNGWLENTRYLWLQCCRGKKVMKVYEHYLRGWSLAMTLFLSLTVTISFIVMVNAGFI